MIIGATIRTAWRGSKEGSFSWWERIQFVRPADSCRRNPKKQSTRLASRLLCTERGKGRNRFIISLAFQGRLINAFELYVRSKTMRRPGF